MPSITRVAVVAASVVVLVGGCGSPNRATAGNAQQTAHWAEVHGDGYRKADDPDAIARLLGRYAGDADGAAFATETTHGERPGGHVDVVYPGDQDGPFHTSGPPECWRFSWQKRPDDGYIRTIDYKPLDCPPGVEPPRPGTGR